MQDTDCWEPYVYRVLGESRLTTGITLYMSYKKLEIWKLARKLVVAVHNMTIQSLPKFERYEEGSQIRRSCKSIKSNIVEGYARRQYKQGFLRFLSYALASTDETIDHLETLFET